MAVLERRQQSAASTAPLRGGGHHCDQLCQPLLRSIRRRRHGLRRQTSVWTPSKQWKTPLFSTQSRSIWRLPTGVLRQDSSVRNAQSSAALGYRKALTRWILHTLTDSMRFNRIFACQSLPLRSPPTIFWKTWSPELRAAFSATPTHTVPFGVLERKNHLHKQSRACTSRRFFYAAPVVVPVVLLPKGLFG